MEKNKGKVLRYACAVFALVLLMAVHPAMGQQQAGEADAVYRNGYIYTVDAFRYNAQAVAIRDGKFVKIGTNEEMKKITGAMMMLPSPQPKPFENPARMIPTMARAATI